MKKEVIITGGSGKIGGIILKGLSDVFSLIPLDINTDIPLTSVSLDIAREYETLREIAKNRHAIIHLAWDSRENWKTGIVVPKNKMMAENVYKVAVEAKVKRVIMASSVHADDYQSWGKMYSMNVDSVPTPDSPYGATKVYIESLGRYYACRHGLEVVCIRFGGVDPQDIIRPEQDYRKIILSRRDCVSLIKCCLEAEKIPENFYLLYGISDNTGRIHEWHNSLGWVPQDDGAKM